MKMLKTVPAMMGAAAVAIALSTSMQASAADNAVKNIVLVHGAFADGTGWKAVSDILTKDGYKVSVVQQPLTGLQEDVAATQRVLDDQVGPVVLVGHSYGGQIITDAGNDDKVKALVYVAALVPDAGDTVQALVKSKPAVNDDVKLSKDQFLYLDPSKFVADFAADLPKGTSSFMALSQMPVALKAFMTPNIKAAWHDKPSYAIVATQDKSLNPDLERWMYKRAGADVTEIKGSHVVFISQPKAVAAVIEKAAKSVK